MRIAGVILAGGQATRMGGGDKGMLVLGGQSLFDRVIDRLGPQVGPMAISANGNPMRLGEYGLPVLPDPVAGYPGPLAGVLAGLDWAAAAGMDRIVTVAADTPFFAADLTAKLERASIHAGRPLALAASEHAGRLQRQPTFGLWPVGLRDDLRRALAEGVRKVTDWADRHGAVNVLFPEAGFFNINTPGDLARAEALLETGGA